MQRCKAGAVVGAAKEAFANVRVVQEGRQKMKRWILFLVTLAGLIYGFWNIGKMEKDWREMRPPT